MAEATVCGVFGRPSPTVVGRRGALGVISRSGARSSSSAQQPEQALPGLDIGLGKGQAGEQLEDPAACVVHKAAGDVEQAEAQGLGAGRGQLVGQRGGLLQGEQVEGQYIEPPPGCMGAGAPSARSDCRAGRRRPSRSS